MVAGGACPAPTSAALRFPGWFSYKANGHGRAMLAPTRAFSIAQPFAPAPGKGRYDIFLCVPFYKNSIILWIEDFNTVTLKRRNFGILFKITLSNCIL